MNIPNLVTVTISIAPSLSDRLPPGWSRSQSDCRSISFAHDEVGHAIAIYILVKLAMATAAINRGRFPDIGFCFAETSVQI
jgi:hypothetical protein